MKKMRKRIALFFALSLCVSVRPVLAKRMVSDFSEFKQLCESDTKETIELTSDIIVDETVVIRGEKIIHGRGHRVIRSALPRSEERRVGKECRSRWSPYH